MDEKQKKRINRSIVIVTSIMAAIVLGYIVYLLVVKKTIGTTYYVVIIGFLAVYWLLTNVVEVVLTKELQEKTAAQVRAYKIYALLNLVGVAGLGYFGIAIADNNGMMGALVYVAAMMAKRRYWEEYLGIKKEEDTDADSDVTEADEQESGAAGDEKAIEKEAEAAEGIAAKETTETVPETEKK